MKQKAIIFDLGGVLLTYQHQAVIEAIARLCQGNVEAVRGVLSRYGDVLGTGAQNGRFLYQVLQQEAGLVSSYEALETAVCTYPRRDERALALVRELAKRPFLALAIISNTVEQHAAWQRRHVPELSHCHPVIFSNEVGLLKPDPAIYQLALAQLGLPPQQTLFIDDNLPNVTAAQQLHMAAHHHQGWDETEQVIEEWLGRMTDDGRPTTDKL